jgi:flagellar motor switch protein FliN/FliY
MAGGAWDGERMSEHDLKEPVRNLLDHWTQALVDVLQAMTDQKPEVKWQSGITLAADPEALWWEQPFQVSDDAIVWIAAPQPTWEHAGTVTLQAAGLETVEVNEARSTWLEILGQSLGGLARSIGAVIGREVTCAAGTEHAPESPPETGAAISIKIADRALPPLWLGLSPALVSLVCSPPPPPPPAPEVVEAVAERPRQEIAERNHRAPAPQTMDLIMDVELPVSISFGKTDLPMKDVLKLTTGSIVELNRGVNDPVEVMINHCLIARGEVVVVEGNYGVRIQQIASRLDRMRSLR